MNNLYVLTGKPNPYGTIEVNNGINFAMYEISN